MAWEDELFTFLDDLEQQAEAAYALEREVELADRSRAEYAAVTLTSRLMASVGSDLLLDVRGPGRVAGRLERLGRGWLLLAGADQDWLVRTAAVVAVEGASGRSVPEAAWSPLTRLGLGSALRRLADSAQPCVVHELTGARHEVVLQRVGADFVEARAGLGRTLLLALDQMAGVQRRD